MITIEEEKETSWEGEFESEKGGVAHKDLVAILLTRANSRTCFFSTLNLKKLRCINERRDRVQPSVKEEPMVFHKVEAAQVSGEDRPVCDVISLDSSNADYNSDTSINKKKRAISRMKELLKWAATAKSDKGGNKRWKVPYFRHRGTTKALSDDTSTESRKISFSWDVGSCSSASSSSLSPPLSLASSSMSHRSFSKRHSECFTNEICDSPKTDEFIRTGNWITTDSEFVVLEL